MEKTTVDILSQREYKRKLASVQIIDNILPHNNADLLAIAKVMDWHIVIKKDEFKIGDKIIYFEIDSLCPDTPHYQLLKKCKFRIKTIKLRGQLSQGLILPISIAAPNPTTDNWQDQLKIGMDLTDQLGICKYENPEDTGLHTVDGMKVENFPSGFGFSKTDEMRIQSSNYMLSLFFGQPWYATVKCDGCSFTTFMNPFKDDDLIVCSRNLTLHQPEADVQKKNTYWYIVEKYKLKTVLSKYRHLVIQGEICGPTIQKNLLKLKDYCLYVFTMFDLKLRRYCTYQELIDNCNLMNLNTVPIETEGDSFNYTQVGPLLELAKGKYNGTKSDREGLVFRLKNTDYVSYQKDIGGPSHLVRASFKVINNDYLLKE